MRLRRRQQLAQEGRQPDEYCRSDGLAGREATIKAFAEKSRRRDNGEGIPLPVAFLATLAPYFQALPDRQIKAFQLTPEFIAELEDAEPNLESVQQSRADLRGITSAYVDVPAGAVMLGDAVDLRAIFIETWTPGLYKPLPDGTTKVELLCFCAVVAPHGQYGWRHVLWLDDRSVIVADNHRPDDLDEEWARDMPLFDQLLEQAGVSQAQFLDDIERLVFLVLDRSRTHLAANVEPIPFMPLDHPRRRPGHGDAVGKRFSLFKVKRLTPRARINPVPPLEGHNEDPAADAERQFRPWRLGRRIVVSGHWRNQPVGKRGEGQIRRIWIDEHQKGPFDGLPLHPMARLVPVGDPGGEPLADPGRRGDKVE
jgi:hypothetical protein